MTLTRWRLVAKIGLAGCLPLAIWWTAWSARAIPQKAALGFVATFFITEPWGTELSHYAYLFPQHVVAGRLVEAFLKDFPADDDSPFTGHPTRKGITVPLYFNVVKEELDHYHVRFKEYPPPEHLPPVPKYWPPMDEVGVRYVRLSPDAFLLGWAGPDKHHEALDQVLQAAPESIGLIRLGDDWWVRCESFDFAQYRRRYPKLAKEVFLDPDRYGVSWPIVEQVLRAKGIDTQKELERFRVLESDARLEWGPFIRHPVSLALLLSIAGLSLFLWGTRSPQGKRHQE